MEPQTFVQSVVDRLQQHANVKTVYGEPVTLEGRTIIPLSKVAYAFGGGLGGQMVSSDYAGNTEGIGFGAAINVNPIGVIEITDEQINYISIESRKKLFLAALAGAAVALFLKKLF